MSDLLFWFGCVLLALGVVGLACPSVRSKGEYYTPFWVLVGIAFAAVHMYNYVRLAGMIGG